MSEMLSIGEDMPWLTLLHPLMATFPRFVAAFAVMPLLTKATMPRQVRLAFVLILVLVTYPGTSATFLSADWGTGLWIGFVVKEVFIGALIGYAVGMILWMFIALGELIDVQAGFNNAQIFDPFGGHAMGPMSVLLGQIGVLFFVGFGGLHVVMQLLYESLVLWPPGSFTPDLGGVFRDFSIATSGSMLETAARLAAPVIGALLLVELGIGLINRVAPQLDTFYFSMPIKAVVAILVLALLLVHLADVARHHVAGLTQLLPSLGQILPNR